MRSKREQIEKLKIYFKHCESKSQDIAVELILQSGDTEFWKENSDKEIKWLKFIEDN